MAGKKILLFAGDFVETYEVMVPYQCLVMLGHEVHSVCPGKRKGDTVRTAVHDFEGEQTFSEKPGHTYSLTADFREVEPTAYDGLVLPGGRSPEYLRLNARILEFTRHFFQTNKPVLAMAQGVQILTAANVLAGRSCTSWITIGPECRLAGATYLDIDIWLAHTDGNLVTTPAWPGIGPAMREFVRLLEGRKG